MFDPENDWVKKRKTRRAIGRRTVLVKVVLENEKTPHLGKQKYPSNGKNPETF